jgi:hypothetical protein
MPLLEGDDKEVHFALELGGNSKSFTQEILACNFRKFVHFLFLIFFQGYAIWGVGGYWIAKL